MTEALLELAEFVAHRGARRLDAARTHALDPATLVEHDLVGFLSDARPGDGWCVAGASRQGTTGVAWHVAVDGIVNVRSGIPHRAVVVTVTDDLGALIHVVRDPDRDESFVARRGHGATRDAHEATARNEESDRAVIALEGDGAWPTPLDGSFGVLRRFGTPALDAAWVAAGRLDAAVTRGERPADWTGSALMVLEAAGRAEVIEVGPSRLWVVGSRPLVARLAVELRNAEDRRRVRRRA